jgi:hypothetical protein
MNKMISVTWILESVILDQKQVGWVMSDEYTANEDNEHNTNHATQAWDNSDDILTLLILQ